MPELYLDTSNYAEKTIKQKIMLVAQGVDFIGGDIAQKVVISPMKYAFKTTSSNILPARPGISYFIHAVGISVTMAVDKTGISCEITFTQNGALGTFPLLCQTLTSQSLTVNYNPDIITDENKAVALSASGTFTTFLGWVAYQEVQQNAIPR
jgi:hypothetical protein